MSAICGILGRGGAPPDLQALSRMMRALENHGPDGHGSWHDAQIGLGHQMLHITPESLAEQLPLHHRASAVTLTADARLDNRDELLPALGLAASAKVSDSELLLQAWLKWGKACAERLIGEFSAAVWDARERRLHLVTDSMGVRPLFYTEVAGRYFAFASEVEALLRLKNPPPGIDRRRLAMLGVSAMTVYLEPERTCFEGIRRVPAASVLSVGERGIDKVEYWRPDASRRLHFTSDGECREAFQEVFFKAVRARLRSAFPVASLLSGGLDSSAIVGAASRILKQENGALITLSSVPEPSATGLVVDEREYVALFRGHENLLMREVCAPGCGPFDDLPDLVRSASFCSYSFQHYLYSAFVRAAREQGARVILDGHGGELSASCTVSSYFAELLRTGRWRNLVTEMRLASPQGAITPAQVKRSVLQPLAPYFLRKWLKRHNRFGDLLPFPLQAGYVRDVLGSEAAEVKERVLRLLYERPNHRKNMVHNLQLEQGDARQRSHAGFIGYQDAAFSYPFFDRRVLEFALAVDGRFKVRANQDRVLLRLGMEGLLPREIASRASKAPFAPDYHLRYERQKDRAFKLLNEFSGSAKLRGIVDFERVLRALQKAPVYNAENPMRGDREAQFTVPYATYLCYFLDRFENRGQEVGAIS